MKRKPNQNLTILHGDYMPLETFARSLFGDTYYGSVSWHQFGEWKKFYQRTLKVLQHSGLRSVGSIDEMHRAKIEQSFNKLNDDLKNAKTKDRMHTVLIVGLFKLVFLLFGRLSYKARGNYRNLNTFRTMSYCQTDEQLSWLLQGFIQRSAQELGYEDSFDADYAYFQWTQEKKLKHVDRSNYVAWVREKHQSVLLKFR